MTQPPPARESAHTSRLARRLLRLRAPASQVEFLLGDIEERYAGEIAASRNKVSARLWYWRQIFSIVTPGWGRVQRRSRKKKGDPFMQRLFQDLRFAFRLLAKSPGFTAVAILSLALGIGANTTIFSVFNSILLRPLPGREPERLVTVYTSDYSGPPYGSSSYPDYLDFQRQNQVLSGLAAYRPRPLLVKARQDSFRSFGEFVSANYFEVLQLKASLGRLFEPSREPGSTTAPVTVISYGLWQRRFGGTTSILGRHLIIDNKDFTVIGVAPRTFTGMMRGLSVDLWIPMTLEPEMGARRGYGLDSRSSRGLQLVGRLKPGVTAAQANANLRLIGEQLYQQYPDKWDNRLGKPRTVTVLSEKQSRVPPRAAGAVSLFLSLLLAAVGMVLLIACANVANLQLARANSRGKEVAIRISLGASRTGIIRQLLVESVMVALLAGAAGVLLALLAVRLLVSFRPPIPVPIDLNLAIDTHVLLFTAGISLLTGLLFGLAPALRATRARPALALKEGGGQSPGYRRSLLRSGLVVAQISVSLLLLVGAGLFLRSLASAGAINPGFNPENLLLFSVDLGSAGYDSQTGSSLARELQESLQGMAPIRSASLTSALPLELGRSRRSVSIEDYRPAQGEDMEIPFANVGPGYFQTLEIPLLRGRAFAPSDGPGAPQVVIVNQAFVRRYWPAQNPLGKHLTIGRLTGKKIQNVQLTVIGVAQTGKYMTLGEEPTPYLYYPFLQNYASSLTFVIRTRTPPDSVAQAVRRRIQDRLPTLPVFNLKTMEEHLGISLFPVRMASVLMGVMGGLALILAITGLFGVISYAVSQRTREIGVRMAFGAGRGDISRMVLRQALFLTLMGSILGLAGALVLTRFASFLLYGVSRFDPLTFAGVTVLLTGIALLACWIPARRASSIDPLSALRYE